MPPETVPGPVPEPEENVNSPAAEAIEARLTDGAIDLPILPQVANQVLALTARPDGETTELVALIHRDQALAANVLRVANSVLYGGRIPIVSLHQATARLGMDVLSQIALSASMQTDLYRVPGFESEITRLWRHAIASGFIAREIARHLRCNVESAFLCGLLHGIGKPVILRLASELRTPEGFKLELEEVRSLMERFHVEAGTMLAAEWNLPDDVTQAMAVCADDDLIPECAPEPLTATVAAALARKILGWEPDLDLSEHPALEQLNFYPEDVDDLFERSDEIFAHVDTFA